MSDLRVEFWEMIGSHLPDDILRSYHTQGTATFKSDEYFETFGAKNKTGILTSWLEGKIAVFFGAGQLITFEWSHEKFLSHFSVDFTRETFV